MMRFNRESAPFFNEKRKRLLLNKLRVAKVQKFDVTSKVRFGDSPITAQMLAGRQPGA